MSLLRSLNLVRGVRMARPRTIGQVRSLSLYNSQVAGLSSEEAEVGVGFDKQAVAELDSSFEKLW